MDGGNIALIIFMTIFILLLFSSLIGYGCYNYTGPDTFVNQKKTIKDFTYKYIYKIPILNNKLNIQNMTVAKFEFEESSSEEEHSLEESLDESCLYEEQSSEEPDYYMIKKNNLIQMNNGYDDESIISRLNNASNSMFL